MKLIVNIHLRHMAYRYFNTYNFIFLFIWLGSVSAQPPSNPFTLSNSPNRDVVCENLVVADSAIFFTGVYRDSGMGTALSGSFVKRFDSHGHYKDSINLSSILPSDQVYGAQGTFHNDSLTIFGFYLDSLDSINKSYLLRLARDFSGYRFNQYFINNSGQAIVSRARFDVDRNVICAFIDREKGGPSGGDTAFYFEFDPGSLKVLRQDTITLAKRNTYFRDFLYFNNGYVGLESVNLRIYDNQMDSIRVIPHFFGPSIRPDSAFVPHSALVVNNKLFAFATNSEFHHKFGYKGALIVLNGDGSTSFRTYPNPTPSIYEDEWIDGSAIYQVSDKFLLLSTLNFNNGLLYGPPTGDNTDILIRMVDTATLEMTNYYILADSCFNYVTAAAQTDSGFAILYFATCTDNYPKFRVSRIAFFNEQGELLSDREVARIAVDPEVRELTVYPNPVGHYLNFSVNGLKVSDTWRLQVLNAEGRVLHKHYGSGPSGNISVETLPSSQYILELIPQQSSERFQSIFIKK